MTRWVRSFSPLKLKFHFDNSHRFPDIYVWWCFDLVWFGFVSKSCFSLCTWIVLEGFSVLSARFEVNSNRIRARCAWVCVFYDKRSKDRIRSECLWANLLVAWIEENIEQCCPKCSGHMRRTPVTCSRN